MTTPTLSETRPMTTTDPTETIRMSSPNGMACPQCGGTSWRVWMTRPRPGRVDRIRRCQGCRFQVRTSERVTGRDPNQKRAAG